MLGCVGYLIVACHAPLTYWRNDFQVGGKRLNRDIEAHLVIALTSAAMCYTYSSLCTRYLNQEACDQRTSQSGRKRILPLVDCSCLQGRPYEVTHKIGTAIDNQRIDRANFFSSGSDSRQVSLIANVDGERKYIQMIVFFYPMDGDRGI